MLLQQAVQTAVLIVTISLTINATSLTDKRRYTKDDVLHEFRQFDKSGIITEELSEIMKQLPLSSLFSMTSSTPSTTYDSTICLACYSVFDALTEYITTHSKEELFNLAFTMCTDLIGYSTEICSGVIELNLDTVLYVLKNTEEITSGRFCGILLQGNECSKDEPSLEWTVDVDLGHKPEVNRMDNRKTDLKADVLTIVQLSDIHHDPVYLPQGNAVCGAPMCCRSSQGIPEGPQSAAGYWGDYRSCDAPWHLYEDTLQQIKDTHPKIDYIYMTGDIVDHAVWDTSIPLNTDVITKVLTKLKTEFPDTPVYPVLGNHEPSPLNVFAPHYITDENLSTKWLYELSADLWSVWLPPETRETILHGGFYTVLARPGFRIIALNGNLCYTFNWWLIHDSKDQDGQLKWLAEILLQAEKDEEKVHILSHIPTGSTDCIRTWGREFHKIIDRFENIVTAIFNGHTHNDHFHVYYANDEPTRPNNVAFNGGSVTTFSDLNSNYKTHSVDSITYDVLESESWIFNLTEANINANTNPTWFKLYSFKDVYGVENLTPTELDRLTHKLAGDRSLLEKYSRHYVKNGDTSLASGCDTECLKSRLCYTATFKVGDSTQCNILLEEFDAANRNGGVI